MQPVGKAKLLSPEIVGVQILDYTFFIDYQSLVEVLNGLTDEVIILCKDEDVKDLNDTAPQTKKQPIQHNPAICIPPQFFMAKNVRQQLQPQPPRKKQNITKIINDIERGLGF